MLVVKHNKLNLLCLSLSLNSVTQMSAHAFVSPFVLRHDIHLATRRLFPRASCLDRLFSTSSESDSYDNAQSLNVRSTKAEFGGDSNDVFSINSKQKPSIAKSPKLKPDDPSTFPSWAYDPRDYFRYELIYESKKSMARVGRIHTPHGIIDTPGYVAVATNGALKGLDMREADACGQQLVFCNSYHLLLQPGPEIIEGAGGLHKFMNRPNGPLITDSGGFQVFSLAYGSVHESLESQGELKKSGNANKNHNKSSPVKVTEEGVLFRSYRDGRKILLTPESTIQAQKSYGADIIIPLDELPPYHIDRKKLEDSVDRSHRWEARSLKEHLKNVKNQAMYCVVHGGVDVELRTKSIEYLTSLPFDGYAIGGSLGRNSDELLELLNWMMPLFNESSSRKNKPRHLLGIADEKSIVGGVKKGIDTFDSCYPTRLGRHGTLLTRNGKIHIKSSKHSKSYGVPIDSECKCSTCTHYDRSYLWHLFKAKEPLLTQLATVHNIQYMNDLMAKQRQDILDGKI
uniref:tRNA-guanine(15) transglycosylase-like domain-containing protein n=1 Tax=Eucampia antarctica TaxID=49252 RepID=A0A7S2SGE4_9STRA|mmetsp:Transcript_7875/g.7467  ORF Transcript_7875/g.7467 Transcript_7875/m.7467 type:complete len:513 (+) Transcript_7875:110-1648(+)